MDNTLLLSFPEDLLIEVQVQARERGLRVEEFVLQLVRQGVLPPANAYGDGEYFAAPAALVAEGDGSGAIYGPASLHLLFEDEGLTPSLEDASSVNPEDRRLHQRVKIDLSAMLYLRSGDRRNVVYKSGDVKDIAPGGVLLECGTDVHEEQMFVPGAQFELIFQLHEDEPPMHLQCQIRRVRKESNKTSLGVAFTDPDPDIERMVATFGESGPPKGGKKD
ncbi:PilZ domain-containing protein [Desulfovibrio sp. OttesenSCG-928-C14]|nr:PilZ domain-containing protein [Desulfovibrio sp. OttesenSCG-928-C14]